MKIDTLAIIGVGLIGGSIGLAAKRRAAADRVIGVGRQQSSLDRALALGAIDEAELDIAAAVARSQMAIFCTPVERIADQVLQAALHCAQGTILTDAGSVKSKIVGAVEGNLPPGIQFVGSHPLAGSEKRGPEHADADLFQGRLTIVTCTPKTDPAAVDTVSAFWQALGSCVKILSPEEHDHALAMTSHLPHLLASALAGILPAELHDLTATGFRDTTRIAAGDPSIWTGIFQQNSDAVLEALATLQTRLKEYERILKENDSKELDRLLAEAKKNRDGLK